MVTWHDLPAKYEVKGIALYAKNISFSVREYVSAQTLSADNFVVLVDCSATNINITLPQTSSHNERVYTIKKIDKSTHKIKVTVGDTSSEGIDGETSIEIKSQYAYVTIVSSSAKSMWFIIGGEYVKMEDTLVDIKDTLEDLLEQYEKGLVIQGEVLEHIKDASTADPDREEVEEGLRDMIPEVKD